MENRSLLNKYNIPISHLDFRYVEACTNIKELERIVMILRSGEEGFYPDLTRCAEEKLKELKPDSRVLRKEERVLTKDNLSQEEWQKHNEPIIEWSSEIKSKDAILSTIQESSSALIEESLAPIRKGGRVSRTKEKIEKPTTKTGTREATSRPAATNYSQWDKYDADAEILKMDLDEEREKEHVERMNKVNKHLSVKAIEEDKSHVYSKLTLIEKEKLSEDSKIRGNECFKSKEYKEALDHYTRCIHILPTAAGYNNRAIANIKLLRYTEAVSDCDECLQLDANNVKALLRKALALIELGNKINAYQTYEQVKSIDANNATACKALEDLRRELGDVAPSHATRIKIVENEKASHDPKSKSVVSQGKKLEVKNPPPVVDYDLAELVKPKKVVKSKLAKTMECFGKMGSKKDGKGKPAAAAERMSKLMPKEHNSEIKLLIEDPASRDCKGKSLIQEL